MDTTTITIETIPFFFCLGILAGITLLVITLLIFSGIVKLSKWWLSLDLQKIKKITKEE
jgi:hypothetical protein